MFFSCYCHGTVPYFFIFICSLTSLAQTMTWGVWPDLDLGAQRWFWPLPNKNCIIRRTLTILLRWCLTFCLCGTFGRGMGQKPRLDVCVIDLTSEVAGWSGDVKVGYQLLRLVTVDMLFFCETNSIKGETTGGGIYPLGRGMFRKPLSLARVNETLTWLQYHLVCLPRISWFVFTL